MKEFEKHLNRHLRASEHHLDAETCRKLDRARLRALQQAKGSRPWFSFALPATGAAMAGLLIVLLVFSPGETLFKHSDNAEDYMATEGLEFYEELDFYYWLAEDEFNG